jgi:hypothetical protein
LLVAQRGIRCDALPRSTGGNRGGGGGLQGLQGLKEIERLRARLGRILWAVESERYQLQGLRAFVRQQCAEGLGLDDGEAVAPPRIQARRTGVPERLQAAWKVAKPRT